MKLKKTTTSSDPHYPKSGFPKASSLVTSLVLGAAVVLSGAGCEKKEKEDAEPKKTTPQKQNGATTKTPPASEKDTDKDGIPDSKDACVKQWGPKDSNGCPRPRLGGVARRAMPMAAPDKDGDGVPDKVDKCPDIKGVKHNDGCPAPRKKGLMVRPNLKTPKNPGVSK